MDWRVRLPGAIYRQARDRAESDIALAALVVGWLTAYVETGTPIATAPISGREIQRIRQRLGETTETFGARFGRSRRAVETWEQDIRVPEAVVLATIRGLDRDRA